MSNSPHERRKLDSAPIPSTDVASVLLAAPLQIGQAEALPVRDGVNGPELEHQAEEPIITTLSNGVVDDHKEDGEEAPFDEEEHEEKLKIWDIFAEEYHDGKLICSSSVLDLSFYHLERFILSDDSVTHDDELWLMLSMLR